jgi:ribonuclease E
MSNNNNKMLIDATHPEETRVVVLKNGRVEEFDFESAARKLLRGNIYLAKVTRVEPSLQAAFIDYGGNRHGFLAFNEIHPDYYQIPVADRQALLDEEAAQEAAEEAEVDAHAERLARRREQRQREAPRQDGDQRSSNDADHHDHEDGAPEVLEGADHDGHHHDDHAHDDPHHDHDHDERASDLGVTPNTMLASVGTGVEQIVTEPAPPVLVGGFDPDLGSDGAVHHHGDHDHDHVAHDAYAAPLAVSDALQPTLGEDVVEEMPQRPRRRPRSYKIQEVIKRRQVILVQVVKEERGNKGAALTTYLSLAGRYTVLMPNTARGGGISRKITQPGDRKRLKAIANELEVPEGMGLIIRTAGASRTSQEIKRDFEYLLRLWESVRELTLASTAPSLVYEEGNLIKRSIRDLYTKDVEEVVVAGEVAHKEARDFMRMLMPSHAQNVIEYKGAEPLFTRYRMEQQLAAMFSPQVTLRSGGYLVINQTEALVAVDVNSGKSTREYSIEETALNTNLEAADEIARQLKLRDLAGLVVIDFIDMEEKRNNRAVERRLKDALRFDRARIQLGRISHFGLMEMSRQRLRTGVLEGSTSQCPHCQGTGIIRSIESVALAVLRGLEDTLMSGTRMALVATTTPTVALYILNAKRAYVTDMEARHGLSITVQGSDKLQGANFTIDKIATSMADPMLRRRPSGAVNMESGFDGEGNDPYATEPTLIDVIAYDDADEDEAVADQPARAPSSGAQEDGRKRRRRGRRSRRDERPSDTAAGLSPRNANAPDGDGYTSDDRVTEVGAHADFAPVESHQDGDDDAGQDAVSANGEPRESGREGEGRRGRRRGRRGGRRGGQNRDRTPLAANDATVSDAHGEADEAGHHDEGHAHAAEPTTHGHAEQSVGHAPATAATAAAPHVAPATVNHVPVAPAVVSGTPPVTAQTWHQQPAANDEPTVEKPTPAVPVVAAAVPPTPVESKPVTAVSVASAPPAPLIEVPKPPRRVASTSSEPILERVVLGTTATSQTHDGADETAKPVRKGWWQRKLGLD